MLEIKVTLELSKETSALLTRFMDLVERGKLGNDKPATEIPAPKTTPKATIDKDPKPTPRGGLVPQDKTACAPQPEETAPISTEQKAGYDIEDVRSILADAKRAYGLDKVKELLIQHGAASGKLADLPEKNYDAVVEAVKALGE